MKYYKMASIPNPSIVKQPLKQLEFPLTKFAEEVIPYHQKAFEEHKISINKLIIENKTEQLGKEIKAKKRSIKQIRDLMYELDTLRSQVEDADLDQFDTKTMPLRSSLLKLTKGYQDLEKTAENLLHSKEQPVSMESINPFEGVDQIQTQKSLVEIKLQHEQERLQKVEEIQRDTEDLHEIYKNLHGRVKVQGDTVEQVENNVEESKENVNQGLYHLIKANKLTTVAYPTAGAFIGTLVGGPIGFIAGLKVGGAAALTCAVAGYTGGMFLKKQKDMDVSEEDAVSNNENNENHTVIESMKKDI